MHGAWGRRAIGTGVAIVLALAIAGCSKGEPETKQVKPNVPIAPPAPKAAASEPSEPVDESLKDRLARQEAASRMFERNVLQPSPPRSAEPKPAPGNPPAAAPIQSAPASPPAVAAASPTHVAAVAPTATPAQEPVKAAPVPAPVPPPRTDRAATKTAPASEPAAPRLLSRVEPEFPAEAVRAGIDTGTVLAKLTLDGGGNVTQVEIVNANPRRVFDRSVARALSRWKFNEGSAGRTVESEIAFRK